MCMSSPYSHLASSLPPGHLTDHKFMQTVTHSPPIFHPLRPPPPFPLPLLKPPRPGRGGSRQRQLRGQFAATLRHNKNDGHAASADDDAKRRIYKRAEWRRRWSAWWWRNKRWQMIAAVASGRWTPSSSNDDRNHNRSNSSQSKSGRGRWRRRRSWPKA